MIGRRSFLKKIGSASGAFVGLSAAASQARSIPIIDTHIHLFDPTREGGVPWPEKTDAIYKPSLPPRFASLATGLGVVGAIAIEASPLRSDNDWLLQVAAGSPLIVGVVGDLQPEGSDFAASLDKLHRNPLFLGIRCGNLWDRDLTVDITKAGFLDGLKRLSDAGLVLESANPNPRLIHTLAELTARLPHLRIVIDHLPHAAPPEQPADRSAYMADLSALGASSTVFVKFSEIVSPQAAGDPGNIHHYQSRLDELWEIFGENKVMFGSDWPNSDHLLPYGETFSVFRQFITGKSTQAQEKVYWRNSRKAYRWKRRSDQQPV